MVGFFLNPHKDMRSFLDFSNSGPEVHIPLQSIGTTFTHQDCDSVKQLYELWPVVWP